MKTSSLIAIHLFLSVSFCFAEEGRLQPSATEILKAADRARGNVEGLVWKVRMISTHEGKMQRRGLRITARGKDILAEFFSPPLMKGQKILVLGRNMWFIKPGLSKPVPISPRQRLLGAVSNGDIASTDYAGDYSASLKGSEPINGEECFLLELRAINKLVTYPRIRYWVSKKRLVGIKADFYTLSGKLFKSALFEYKNRLVLEGSTSPFVSRMIIKDALIESSRSILTYTDVKAARVPDASFNLNLLRR